MDQFIRRFGKNIDIDEVLSERGEIDPQDSILADDSDAFRQSKERDVDITLSLKLSESANNLEDAASATDRGKYDAGLYNQEDAMLDDVSGKGQTAFEVISTETVKDGRSNFVIYRILLTKTNGGDKVPCVVDRRYSEFEKLHSKLKKGYPKQMEDISFPKKQLMGNFTAETIARRSRAFEQYLTHIYSVDILRFSIEFSCFFYRTDLEKAYVLLSEKNYIEAVSLLQQVVPVQEKLQGDCSSSVGVTMCALVACYEAMDKSELALKYGEAALKCFSGNGQDKHYVALVQTCIHLSWKLGKNKKHLELKLSHLAGRHLPPEDIPSLMSVVVGDKVALTP